MQETAGIWHRWPGAATSPFHGHYTCAAHCTHLSPQSNAGPQAPTTRPTSRAASTAGTHALVEGAAAGSMAATRPGGRSDYGSAGRQALKLLSEWDSRCISMGAVPAPNRR
jgi:hypothetical protein